MSRADIKADDALVGDLRYRAEHALHIHDHPDLIVLFRGLVELVESSESSADERRRQRELAMQDGAP